MQTDELADWRRYPARRGFEALVLLERDPERPVAWTVVPFSEAGYVWSALQNPRGLRQTSLGLSNGGRHYPPWNGRSVGVLSLEEVSAYFHYGLAESVAKNPLADSGIGFLMRQSADARAELQMERRGLYYVRVRFHNWTDNGRSERTQPQGWRFTAGHFADMGQSGVADSSQCLPVTMESGLRRTANGAWRERRAPAAPPVPRPVPSRQFLRAGLKSSSRRKEALIFDRCGRLVPQKPRDLSLLTSAATTEIGVFKPALSNRRARCESATKTVET